VSTPASGLQTDSRTAGARVAPARSAAYDPRRSQRRRNVRAVGLGLLFIAPTFVILGYFMYYPAYVAFVGSLTDWDGFNTPRAVGLQNFANAFRDGNLRVAGLNNIPWAIGKVFLAVVPPFLAAELIFHVRRQRWQYLYRTLFVVPLIIPGIVTILLWTFYYRSDGLVNQVLGFVGLDALQQPWLTRPSTALGALIFMGFPWVTPFNLLIFYSGLQAIPGEILEAGALDGATGWRRVLFIDLPLLVSQTRVLVTLAIIASVQALLEPLLMTGGGPGTSTLTPILYVYRTGVEYGDFGYSMSISLILFLVVLLLSVAANRLTRSRKA